MCEWGEVGERKREGGREMGGGVGRAPEQEQERALSCSGFKSIR